MQILVVPEMNMLGSTDGRIETDITSPSWSLKEILLWPSSTSQSIQVESPIGDEEMISIT